jgi:peptidoglycan/xylan/chitin deacetylase (PgdA/CDA1 family)
MARQPLSSTSSVNNGTLFEDFETLGDWTKGASGTIATDNTRVKTGASSLKLTSAVGGNCFATRTISQNFQNSGVHGFWVYVEDVTTVLQILVYLAEDSGFANYYSRSLSANSAGLQDGWNFLVIPRSDWSATGTPAWTNSRIRMRVRVDAQTSATAVVYFDSYYYNVYGSALVAFTFDDGRSSQYDEAYTYMQTKNMVGTCFVVRDYVNTATYVTSSNLATMYAAGWSHGNHTRDHTDLTTLTQAQVEAELRENQQYLNSLGYTRASRHVAYPFGGYNATVGAAMQNTGMLTGRTIVSGPAVYQSISKGLYNPYTLRTQYIVNTTSLTTAKARVDIAINTGTPVILTFHRIITPSSGATEDWTVEDFQALVDYVAAKRNGGQLQVLTIDELYARFLNRRYTSKAVARSAATGRRVSSARNPA